MTKQTHYPKFEILSRCKIDPAEMFGQSGVTSQYHTQRSTRGFSYFDFTLTIPLSLENLNHATYRCLKNCGVGFKLEKGIEEVYKFFSSKWGYCGQMRLSKVSDHVTQLIFSPIKVTSKDLVEFMGVDPTHILGTGIDLLIQIEEPCNEIYRRRSEIRTQIIQLYFDRLKQDVVWRSANLTITKSPKNGGEAGQNEVKKRSARWRRLRSDFPRQQLGTINTFEKIVDEYEKYLRGRYVRQEDIASTVILSVPRFYTCLATLREKGYCPKP